MGIPHPKMNETIPLSGEGAMLFFAWCSVLIVLLFYWIAAGSDAAAWGALVWLGFGIVERMSGFRHQFRPGTATEEQRRRIVDLCNELGRVPPANLDTMSDFEAKGHISAMTDKKWVDL